MRLIQVTVPAGELPELQVMLDERDFEHFASPEASSDQYSSILYISVTDEAVESVLEVLYDVGLGSDDHVVIVETEADIFQRTDGQAAGMSEFQRVAAAELEGKTQDLIPGYRTFVVMMVLSTVVATTGLLLDSPAVVVGAMVLAPLFGPAVTASVGTVIDKIDMFRRGIRFQVVGVVVAVVTSTVFAWGLKSTILVPSGFAVTTAPQITARLSPDLLSLVVALVAGTAGVLSVATGAGVALVGVMMAAALLPPAATVGIGIAWWKPAVVVHSGVLLGVNVLAINFASLVTLWYLGYRPQSWMQVPQTRRTLVKRSGVLFLAILVTSAFLWNVTYASVQQSQMEDTIETEVGDILSAEKYSNVTLLDVKAIQDRSEVFHKTERVIVTVGRPPDEVHPGLHRNISETVHNETGEQTPVDIRVSLVVKTGDRSAGSPQGGEERDVNSREETLPRELERVRAALAVGVPE